VPERAVGQPRPQRAEVSVPAGTEPADRHGRGDVPGAGVALGVQPRRVDRGQRDVELAGDQRGGGLGQLIQRGRHEPQPAQRTHRDRDRDAAMHAAMSGDQLKLVVGEAEERGQRGLVDLLREALPLRALAGAEDLDRHQNSISRSATAFSRSASEGRL